MKGSLIEILRVTAAYRHDGLIELQGDTHVEDSAPKPGAMPLSFVKMTPATARALRQLLDDVLNDAAGT